MFPDAELTYLDQRQARAARDHRRSRNTARRASRLALQPRAGRYRHWRPGLRPGPEVPQCPAQPDPALVVDDVLPPGRLRCVMIRGMPEALADTTGPDGQPAGPIIRLHPTQVLS